jgi:hypothetical protein
VVVSRKARGIYEAVERSGEAPVGRVRPEVERRVTEFIREIERQLGGAFEESRIGDPQVDGGSEADAA